MSSWNDSVVDLAPGDVLVPEGSDVLEKHLVLFWCPHHSVLVPYDHSIPLRDSAARRRRTVRSEVHSVTDVVCFVDGELVGGSVRPWFRRLHEIAMGLSASARHRLVQRGTIQHVHRPPVHHLRPGRSGAQQRVLGRRQMTVVVVVIQRNLLSIIKLSFEVIAPALATRDGRARGDDRAHARPRDILETMRLHVLNQRLVFLRGPMLVVLNVFAPYKRQS